MAGQAEEVLSLLRAQRHNFLNHIQVISGLLQLGKPERALAYLKELQLELENWGKLMRLKVPGVVLTCLLQLEEARSQEIAMSIDASTDLAGLNLREDLARKIVSAAWGVALAAAGCGGVLKVNLQEAPGGFYCWIFTVNPSQETEKIDTYLAARLNILEEALAGTPGKYSWQPAMGELKVWLV